MAPPELYCKEGGLAEQLVASCKRIERSYNPTIWAPNGHMQSFMGVLRTLSQRGMYRRQVVMTSDGGSLGLDWWGGSDRADYGQPDTPVSLFIHGINGGSHEGYCKWACSSVVARGWRAVVLNLRGCNGLELTSNRGYTAIQTSDIHVAICSIKARFPNAPLLAAGYSLGSVLLTKYVAEADAGIFGDLPRSGGSSASDVTSSSSSSNSTCSGSATTSCSGQGSVTGSQAHAHTSSSTAATAQPDSSGASTSGSGLVAAVLVSCPVCIHATNSKLGSAWNFEFIYNLAVAYKLREYLRHHLPSILLQGGKLEHVQEMLSSWTTARFDEYVTLQNLGYETIENYYRHACTTNYIPFVRTPCLFLLARDDPFLGVLPDRECMANPFTALALTKRGGHLAFLQGLWPLGPSYMDKVVTDFMSTALRLWRSTPGQDWSAKASALGCHVDPMPANVAYLLANARCNCMLDLDPAADVAPLEATMKVVTAPVRGAAAAVGAKGTNAEVVEAAAAGEEGAAASAAAATAVAAGGPGGGSSGGAGKAAVKTAKGRGRSFLFSRL